MVQSLTVGLRSPSGRTTTDPPEEDTDGPEEEQTDGQTESTRTLDDLRTSGDAATVDRTAVLGPGDIPVKPGTWPFGFPLQLVPRVAVTASLQYVQDEDTGEYRPLEGSDLGIVTALEDSGAEVTTRPARLNAGSGLSLSGPSGPDNTVTVESSGGGSGSVAAEGTFDLPGGVSTEIDTGLTDPGKVYVPQLGFAPGTNPNETVNFIQDQENNQSDVVYWIYWANSNGRWEIFVRSGSNLSSYDYRWAVVEY